ncbi:MAG TPA: 2-succinyl-5-enolpyruvyl-6-hydroxy-3-cyclohexene-1-carboxylic-acid synthase, partial [Acidimicrobiales bacterium]|nr:2-succinyl-5-enolpyruvyl-6-hydroxy-3-cyclohexene-1-carboxylic-acid synthase [Acidimicrobiales bacterium]
GVVEASHAGVPLVVCTADRPPRLHHVGAPQTIEQTGLYRTAVRWSFDPGPIRDADRSWWRSLGARSVAEAVAGAGPVHLNLAFDEPLHGVAGPLPDGTIEGAAVRAGEAVAVAGVVEPEPWSRPGLIVAGGGAPDPDMVLALADHLGWPLLADPRSRARVEHPSVVAAADAILRDAAAREVLRPETVLLVGQPWTSRVLAEFIQTLGRSGTHVVASGARVADPGRVVGETHPSASGLVRSLLALAPSGRDDSWRGRWERVEAAAQGAIDKAIDNDPLAQGGRATEPSVARHLYGALDASTALFASSSMPVRELEWFAAPRSNPPRVLANRGANGIDGITSTALGVAAGARRPVVALLGDLAFLHDVSALVSLRGEGRGSCTLVVLDNEGGGIFNFLPQADSVGPDRFERLFGTPPAVSVSEVGRGFGLPVAEASTLPELDEGLAGFVGAPGCALIRVAVPSREANRALHERVHAAVAEAVEGVLTSDS